jgi:hypothetical protein
METNVSSLKKTARFAGLLYLVWIVTGLFNLYYVPPKIMVPGDIVATAGNILAHEFLFRSNMLIDLLSSAVWVFMILVFYRLFKSVNERQARLMVAFVVVQIPAVFFMAVFNITSLMILKGEILKTFELAQKQDLAMLFLKIGDYGALTLVMFWGLWLFPLAILVYKSRFLPRFLGVWLIIDGFSLLVLGATGLLLPQYKELVYKIAIPGMFGEFALMLWLLIMGAQPKPSAVGVSADR